MSNVALQAVIDRVLAVYRSWGPGTGIEQIRADWAKLVVPPPALAAPEPVSAGGVAAAWIGPGIGPDRAILYLHGGGFQIGSVETHRALMAEIADRAGCRVLGIDYRLAPEHRYPAQLEDALSAYEWLLGQGFAPERIAIAGDSAGGGLTLSLLLALKMRGVRLPAAAAVMSPWTDMAISGASYDTRAAADPIHQRAMMEIMARTFLGREGNPKEPLASPLYGDLGGLPPLLIQVGGREVLFDDSTGFARKAEAAGVDVTLEVWEPMIHVFQLYGPELAETREAVGRLAAFLRHHLGVP